MTDDSDANVDLGDEVLDSARDDGEEEDDAGDDGGDVGEEEADAGGGDAEAEPEAAAEEEAEAEAAPVKEEQKTEKKETEGQERKVYQYGYKFMEKGLADLLSAIKNCEEKKVREVIWSVPIMERCEFVNQFNEDGFSPIMLCTDVEQCDMMQDLLDYGADPSALNYIRTTPLHLACAKNNKRAIKLLIMYGADTQLENNEYQKCHQMVKDQLAMQNYLNQCIDSQKELLKEKRAIPCTRQQRSYIRSIYDIIDVKQLGKVRIDEVAPLLNIAFDGHLEGPDIRYVLEWFKNVDIDKRGLLTFPDFLLACQLNMGGGAAAKGGKKKK